jgi:hypothetical protein
MLGLIATDPSGVPVSVNGAPVLADNKRKAEDEVVAPVAAADAEPAVEADEEAVPVEAEVVAVEENGDDEVRSLSLTLSPIQIPSRFFLNWRVKIK